ncbi:MAG: type II toxin-antitoxin system RelE/ParE family toxin [Syntrophobacter sp.]
MGKFKIFETDHFLHDLSRDFQGLRARIANRLREYIYPQLRDNPNFGKNIKKLRKYQSETWRYRVGDYRFFYQIDEAESIVYMLAVDSKTDSYR